jgi:hypothetical protein
VCGPALLRFLWVVAGHAAHYVFDHITTVISTDVEKKKVGFEIL